MADFGTPVAQNVQPPSGESAPVLLSNLLSLKQRQLGIAQQQIGLEQQQQQLSSETSAATIASINANQQQALSKIDWRQFTEPDGSYDIDGATRAALQVAPNIGPDFVSRLANMAQEGAATKKAFHSLGQDLQDQVRAAFGTWAADPKAKLPDLAATLQTVAENEPRSTQEQLGQIIKHSLGIMSGPNLITGQPKSPQEQKAAALAYSRAGLAPSEVGGPGGVATPIPGTADTGTQIIPTMTSRLTGNTTQAGPAVANLQSQIELSNGQVAILDKKTGKYTIAAAGPPGGAAAPGRAAAGGAARLTADTDPQRPGANAPAWQQQNYGALVQRGQHDVLAAQDADAGYGTNMETADMIRRYSNSTETGPGTTGWTRFLGTIGTRLGAQNVADTQTLASFLDLQSSRLRDSMGLPATNAGLAASQEMGTSIESQRNAIQAKTDYYQALTQLQHEYRQGLDAAGNGGVNPSPSAVSKFKAAFQANADPVNAEIDLALRRGDNAAVKRIVSGLSPQQRMQLVKKRQAMNALMGSLGVAPNG